MSFGQSKLQNKLSSRILDQKFDLNISSNVMGRIHYLHDRFNSVEWSGVLFYTINNAEVSEKNKEGGVECKAIDFMFMDLGTAVYTEYEFTDEVMDRFMELQEVYGNDVKIGHLHTHHSMGAFFSGVDEDELHENAPNHEYYLSLIVNFKGDYVARIAFVGKEESRFTYANKFFNLTGMKKEVEILFQMNAKITKDKVIAEVDMNTMEVDYDKIVGKEMIDHVDKVVKAEEDARKARVDALKKANKKIASNHKKAAQISRTGSHQRHGTVKKNTPIRDLAEAAGLIYDGLQHAYFDEHGIEYKYDSTTNTYRPVYLQTSMGFHTPQPDEDEDEAWMEAMAAGTEDQAFRDAKLIESKELVNIDDNLNKLSVEMQFLEDQSNSDYDWEPLVNSPHNYLAQTVLDMNGRSMVMNQLLNSVDMSDDVLCLSIENAFSNLEEAMTKSNDSRLVKFSTYMASDKVGFNDLDEAIQSVVNIIEEKLITEIKFDGIIYREFYNELNDNFETTYGEDVSEELEALATARLMNFIHGELNDKESKRSKEIMTVLYDNMSTILNITN